ncbi:choice-of-anchor B family protein [Maribacter sp. PR1]|uniref:Choice-of-anchor B family protein n=1 Tax=Maribacter cobaltidurans TaxID=1178778 RepID=A0ABU7IZD3_9FLAO|nr:MULTISPECIES: choice-of-anchor B family protein [Maribacter]MDC6390832.1 choice-of-anchor B family protein [Maribacter sp. PR1]MEE1978224.1 choice-of-anchor B family protein [Maribacter cobaltidurans]
MKNTVLLILMIMLSSCSKNDDNLENESQNETMNPENSGETSLVPCENGFAGEYPCNGYDLLGHIALMEFGAQSANDIWGWTDTMTGKEYAIMGLDNGTAFIDISDTENLIYLGKLPTATTSSSWRDIKVYENFAYIVAEAEGHGVQVFDLRKLRNASDVPFEFEENGRFTDIGNAHNIVINENSGYAYPVGTDRNDLYNGGIHFLDLSNPESPAAAGGWAENGYTHDAQVISYTGPDTDYAGAEIFVGANESQVVVVDITDKENPQEIATLPYPNIGYTHQGWFTEDQRYFILGDELDEINSGFQSRTLVFDMSDLDNPVLHDTYLGPTNAIDHNGYVLGNQFFLANYTAGVRVLDISDIAAKNITEIGFFDTFPLNNNTDFDGVWSVYPFFESGKIVVSDISNGFFVIKKSE